MISKSENGIRYFNSKGVDLVKKCLQTSQEHFNFDQELNDLQDKMLNPEKYLQKENKDFENLLLKTKMFKIHDPKE